MKELIARINAVLKRNKKFSPTISYKNAKLDLNTHTLSIDGVKITLTKNEFTLIKLFFENPNKIFPKSEIANILEIGEKSVNVAVSRLNHKTNLIEAVRGIGYKLK